MHAVFCVGFFIIMQMYANNESDYSPKIKTFQVAWNQKSIFENYNDFYPSFMTLYLLVIIY